MLRDRLRLPAPLRRPPPAALRRGRHRTGRARHSDHASADPRGRRAAGPPHRASGRRRPGPRRARDRPGVRVEHRRRRSLGRDQCVDRHLPHPTRRRRRGRARPGGASHLERAGRRRRRHPRRPAHAGPGDRAAPASGRCGPGATDPDACDRGRRVPHRAAGSTAAVADGRRRTLVNAMTTTTTGSERTYEVRTYGCQMNVHDSERLSGLLEAAGYVRAADGRAGRRRRLQHLRRARERRQPALRQPRPPRAGQGRAPRHADRRRRLPGAEGPGRRSCAGRRGSTSSSARTTSARCRCCSSGPGTTREAQVEILESLEVFPSTLPTRRESAYAAWVSISVGCNNTCTFCIVPSLRGKEKDRRPGDILAEIEALVAEGVIEVTLLGQNVNAYGVEFGDRGAFAQAAARLRRRSTAWSGCGSPARTRRPSPTTSSTRWPRRRTSCRSCTCRCSPAPTASCKAMRRSYRAERYLGIIDRVRAAMPDAAITTDIIVGFPGETEEDFRATLDVVAAARFAQAFTFQYSPRPGTPAAALPDQVPQGRRAGALRARWSTLQEEIAWEENRRQEGRRARGARRRGRGAQGRRHGAAVRPGPGQPARPLRASARPAGRRRPRPGDVVDGRGHLRRAAPPRRRRRRDRGHLHRPAHPSRRRVGATSGRGGRPDERRAATCPAEHTRGPSGGNGGPSGGNGGPSGGSGDPAGGSVLLGMPALTPGLTGARHASRPGDRRADGLGQDGPRRGGRPPHRR